MNTSNAHLFPRNSYLKMQAAYPTLKTAEKRAADALLDDPCMVVRKTIVEAAALSGSSETTWFRLAKKLGYNGYMEMRADFGEHQESLAKGEESAPPYENISRSDTPIEVAQRVFESSINALNDTIRLLDRQAYNRAVEALCGAGSILLCGVGDAHSVVRSAYQKFFLLGLPVFESPDIDLQFVAVGKMQPQDLLIAISYSGRTKSVVNLVKYARERGVQVLAVTNYPNTPLTKNADIVLTTAAFEKNAGDEIVSKRITQMALMESLYVNYLLRADGQNSRWLRQSAEALQNNKI